MVASAKAVALSSLIVFIFLVFPLTFKNVNLSYFVSLLVFRNFVSRCAAPDLARSIHRAMSGSPMWSLSSPPLPPNTVGADAPSSNLTLSYLLEVSCRRSNLYLPYSLSYARRQAPCLMNSRCSISTYLLRE